MGSRDQEAGQDRETHLSRSGQPGALGAGDGRVGAARVVEIEDHAISRSR
jgi:hypothetical protein